MHAEILSYSRNRGLFAGVSLSGAVLKADNSENKKLYGSHVSAEQILFGRAAVTKPASARELDATLARYSPRGGHAFTHEAD
jgi:lipid-binding SYLF domain-containing protein